MLKINFRKKVIVSFTPAYQSYYSAGDEAEPYCSKCDNELEDEWVYCPFCGSKLIWPWDIRS